MTLEEATRACLEARETLLRTALTYGTVEFNVRLRQKVSEALCAAALNYYKALGVENGLKAEKKT